MYDSFFFQSVLFVQKRTSYYRSSLYTDSCTSNRRFMAATVPQTKFKFPGTKLKFFLNKGLFNVKEHVLISTFAGARASSASAIHIVNIVKVFYKRNLGLFVGLLIVLTSQILGFGWAGIFRRHLVVGYNVVACKSGPSLPFRALHEKEERQKGGVMRNQFFLMAPTCSFAYCLLPGYLLPILTSLSWLCWMFPRSLNAQQIGSVLHGVGLGVVRSYWWLSVSSYLGSPLATPWFTVANVALGFVIFMYIIVPVTYWFNIYDAGVFPIYSNDLFTSTGPVYSVSAIVDSNFCVDVTAYDKHGQLHLSTLYVFSYGIAFAGLASTVTHAAIFHGKDLWNLSIHALKDRKVDVHARLMRKYKAVPEWWFFIVLALILTVIITVCECFKEQVQLRWWGVLLSCALAFSFGSMQKLGLHVISEYIFGYISGGWPISASRFSVIF